MCIHLTPNQPDLCVCLSVCLSLFSALLPQTPLTPPSAFLFSPLLFFLHPHHPSLPQGYVTVTELSELYSQLGADPLKASTPIQAQALVQSPAPPPAQAPDSSPPETPSSGPEPEPSPGHDPSPSPEERTCNGEEEVCAWLRMVCPVYAMGW